MLRSFHVLTGPTAAGKSGFLLERGAVQPLLVISADSRQIYRMLDIGTGKPSKDEATILEHYGLDFLELGTKFSVYQYLIKLAAYLAELRDDPRMIWICGGTGLYIHALLNRLELGLPPRAALRQRLSALMAQDGVQHWAQQLVPDMREPHNPVRVIRAVEDRCRDAASIGQVYAALGLDPAHDGGAVEEDAAAYAKALAELDQWQCAGLAVLDPGRTELQLRIERRVRAMFDAGLAEEVQALRAAGYGGVDELDNGIAYREAGQLLDGLLSREEAIERSIIRTRQYAKRQRTYFRGRGWPDMDEAALADWFDGLLQH
jgi:tRNA dimethylallyltransferase